MECPACHREQPGSGGECHFCGVIFEKWFARRGRPQTEDGGSDAGAAAGARPGAERPPALPAKPLLSTSSEELLAFRVDAALRTVFALVLFGVDPAMRALRASLSPRFDFSVYTADAVCSLALGIFSAMLAHRNGYSGILTAGGAGLLGGILRAWILAMMVPGHWIVRLKTALPVFGIYTVFMLLGGVCAWFFRKHLDIKLD